MSHLFHRPFPIILDETAVEFGAERPKNSTTNMAEKSSARLELDFWFVFHLVSALFKLISEHERNI
jgi:hypothetical protein